jgi:hypothetical protein
MRRLSAISILFCFACGAPDPEPLPVKKSAALKSLSFAREKDGVAAGFNLDGAVSDFLDDRSCRQQDFVDPSGVPGIDNQLARLLPLVDIAGEGAVEALVQTSIDEGTLLLIFDREEHADGTIDLTVRRGADVPLLGTDGHLLAGQTLALDEQPLLGSFKGARIEGGMFDAGPFEIRLPVIVFNTLYDLTLPNARVRFRIAEDGSLLEGVLGGGAPLPQILGFVRTADERVGGDIEGLLGGSIRDEADLQPDENGACTLLSMAVLFEAVPVFVFE